MSIATLPSPTKSSLSFACLAALRRPAGHPLINLLLLATLCGFLFFYGLTAGELYRTESLRAIIAAEFLRSGNWVVPTLYGEPLLTKPPGMYAAIALVSWPFGGVSEATARLPSALAATGLVFLFYWYFGRTLGRRAGLLAAVVLPASFPWLDKATAAEIDMLQVAWVAAAILFFLRALEEEDKETRRQGGKETDPSPCLLVSLSPCLLAWCWWLASLLCVAGGVLTKWTAPAFFYLTVIPLLWRRGRLRLLWGRHHLVSAALAAGVCLAWAAVAVSLTGWDVFYDTVSREALQRLSPSHHQEAHRQMTPGYEPALYPWAEVLVHPLKLLAMNLPWSAFALLTLRPSFARLWDERGRRLLQALHCWTWPNLIFWSIIPEHASRHSLPLFPGLAGLAAMVWIAWLTGRLRWPLTRVTATQVLIGILACWLVAKVIFVEAVVPARSHARAPRAKGEQLAALVPPGKTLYLFRLKDEGILFYYGREVRRLKAPKHLPSLSEPVYCILEEPEWRQGSIHRAEALLHLRDERGAPIVLVRVLGEQP